MDDAMHISGAEIPIKQGLLSQSELKFWLDNPRIYSIVHGGKESLDQGEIQLELLKRDHVRELIRDIKHHGGLIDPVVVIDESFEVIEGNSRLAAIRHLSQDDPIKFSMVRCLVLPKFTSEEHIYSYLNQQHIQGKTQWSTYEAAGVVYRLRNAGRTWALLKSQMNIGKAKAVQMYETYKFMVDHDEDKPERYSYYQVYLSNRKAKAKREDDKRMDKRMVEEIRKGDVTAQELRTMLPHICDNSKTFNKFISGRNSMLAAFEELEDSGKTKTLLVRLRKIKDQLANMEKAEFDRLDQRAGSDAKLLLRRIKTQSQNLSEKVYGDK